MNPVGSLIGARLFRDAPSSPPGLNFVSIMLACLRTEVAGLRIVGDAALVGVRNSVCLRLASGNAAASEGESRVSFRITVSGVPTAVTGEGVQGAAFVPAMLCFVSTRWTVSGVSGVLARWTVSGVLARCTVSGVLAQARCTVSGVAGVALLVGVSGVACVFLEAAAARRVGLLCTIVSGVVGGWSVAAVVGSGDLALLRSAFLVVFRPLVARVFTGAVCSDTTKSSAAELVACWPSASCRRASHWFMSVRLHSSGLALAARFFGAFFA